MHSVCVCVYVIFVDDVVVVEIKLHVQLCARASIFTDAALPSTSDT